MYLFNYLVLLLSIDSKNTVENTDVFFTNLFLTFRPPHARNMYYQLQTSITK